ncbi:MAG TPA: hypothetical protein VF607_13005 [Verrucomicrobiae bacterium]
MKRSREIKLVLLGSASATALAAQAELVAVNTQNYYTNNLYLPGAGYYHAPFRQWFTLPYNYRDPQANLYFYGGQWGAQPYASITNISTPTAEAVTLAENSRTDISRGGFGSSYGYHSYSSGWGGWGFHS